MSGKTSLNKTQQNRDKLQYFLFGFSILMSFISLSCIQRLTENNLAEMELRNGMKMNIEFLFKVKTLSTIYHDRICVC